MNIRRILSAVMVFSIVTSQITACGSEKQEQETEQTAEKEAVLLADEQEISEQETSNVTLDWLTLANLNTYPQFRKAFESNFKIETESGVKTGCLYINLDGEHEPNNTLFNALSNKTVIEILNDENTQLNLRVAINETYADLEETDENAAIINAYFNLLPDSEDNYFNGSSSLSRGEAMTLVMRAVTPVETAGTPKLSQDFANAVGGEKENPYIAYASYMDGKSYISTSDNSLTEKTFNGKMTRAEYVYLVMKEVYGEESIEGVDISTSKLTDAKENTKASGSKVEILTDILQNPDNGLPTDLFKSLVKANSIGVIPAETRWDESITKSEAIDIFVDTVQAFNEENGYAVDETESKNNPIEDYTAEAKEIYAEHKNEMPNMTEEEFIESYIKLIKSGSTKEDATEVAIFNGKNKVSEEEAKKADEEAKKLAEEAEKEMQENTQSHDGVDISELDDIPFVDDSYTSYEESYSNDNSYSEPTYESVQQNYEPVQQTYEEPVYTPPVDNTLTYQESVDNTPIYQEPVNTPVDNTSTYTAPDNNYTSDSSLADWAKAFDEENGFDPSIDDNLILH
ncbi:MAG: hypothetical protein IJ666_01235 [Ruminococcus sp.]|nr:hypothetical protein [Ruminococcus sp.]